MTRQLAGRLALSAVLVMSGAPGYLGHPDSAVAVENPYTVSIGTLVCPPDVQTVADLDVMGWDSCDGAVLPADYPDPGPGWTVVGLQALTFAYRLTASDASIYDQGSDLYLSGGGQCDPIPMTCQFGYGYTAYSVALGVASLQMVTIPAGYRVGAVQVDDVYDPPDPEAPLTFNPQTATVTFNVPADHLGVYLYLFVGPTPFTDIADSPFRSYIEWLYTSWITSGCAATTFCPLANVTRGQMASFLARALELPGTATDYFTDDETSIHEVDINRLAAAGITTGCTATTFCPLANVTRGQMASFLARGLSLPSTATDFFTDDETSIHEVDINRLAAAGVTTGCTATTFCPLAKVTRGQMAAFLYRALN